MRLFINLVVKDDRQVVAGTGPMPAGEGSIAACCVGSSRRHMLKGVCRKSRSSVARLIFCTLIGFADGGATPTKLSRHESHHLLVTGLRPPQPSVVHITNK